MFLDLIEVLVYTIGINLSVSNIIYMYNIANHASTFYKVIRTIIKYQYLFRFRRMTHNLSNVKKSNYKLADIELKELKESKLKEEQIDDYELINYK